MAARAIRRAGDPAVFDTVRAIQDRGQRHGGQGERFGIAHQGGQVNRFACMICTPVGGQEYVNRAAGLAPFDPTVRKVKGGVGQRQKRQIVGHGDRDKRGRYRPHTARQPRFKPGDPIGVRGGRAQYGVGAGQQCHLGPGGGTGVAQTAHHDGQPIGAQHRGNPQIGQDKPLRRGGGFIRISARNSGGQHINPRRLACQGFGKGQARQHILIKVIGDGGGARPDFLGDLVVEIIVVVFIQGVGKQPFGHRADNIAVTDPRQLQVQRIQIDGFNRQGRITQPGQNIGAAGEPGGGGPVADIEVQFDRAHQRLTTGRRQAGAQHDPVALAMFDAGHAQLRIRHLDREIHIGDLHKRRIIHPGPGQRLVEVHAQARVGIIAVHLRIGHAKAIQPDGPFQRRLDITSRRNILRQSQGGDHPPPLSFGL